MKKNDMQQSQSQFLKECQNIFQISFKSIVELQTTIEEFLQLINQSSIQEFILQFVDDLPPVKTLIKSCSFIEISQITLLTLGKKPAFNQSKRYYQALANRIISILLKVRSILEQTINNEQQQKSMTLIHLAWNYALYQNFLQIEPSGDKQLVFNEILIKLVGYVPNNFDLSEFNKILGQFLLKWRYVLSRLFNQKTRFIELLNQYFDSNNLQQINYNQPDLNNKQILKYYDYNDVKDLCEMVLTYIMPLKTLCFLDAIDFLKIFIDQAHSELQNTSEKQQSLDALLTAQISSDLSRYLQNVQAIQEPEMYAILINFMLNGKILFFDERTTLQNLQIFILNSRELFSEQQFQESIGMPIEHLLNQFQSFQDVIDVQYGYNKKLIKTSLASKKIKSLLIQQFPSYSSVSNFYDAFFELIYKLYCKLAVMFPSSQCSIISCCKEYMSNLTGKTYQLSVNVKSSQQENFVQEDAGNALTVKEPQYLTQEQQMQYFGRTFDSEENFISFVVLMESENKEVEESLNFIDQHIDSFALHLKEYADSNQIDKYDQIAQSQKLESKIKATEYLLTMMKKISDSDLHDQDRLIKYFTAVNGNVNYRQYDENQISQLEQIIKNFEFEYVGGSIKSTEEILLHVLDDILPQVDSGVEQVSYSLEQKMQYLQTIREDFYLAKTIPLHQFEKIEKLVKLWVGNFKSIFSNGQMIDLTKERQINFVFEDFSFVVSRIKEDSNDLLKYNDDVEKCLFFVLSILIILDFGYEYSINGLIILNKDEFIDL